MKREVTNQEILTGCNSADSPIMSQAWIAAGGHIRPTLARFVGLRLEDPWLGFSDGGTMGFTAMFDVSGGYSGGTMDWTWSVPALFLNFSGTEGTNGSSTRATARCRESGNGCGWWWTLPRCPHPNLNVEPDLNIWPLGCIPTLGGDRWHSPRKIDLSSIQKWIEMWFTLKLAFQGGTDDKPFTVDVGWVNPCFRQTQVDFSMALSPCPASDWQQPLRPAVWCPHHCPALAMV